MKGAVDHNLVGQNDVDLISVDPITEGLFPVDLEPVELNNE